MRLKYRYSAAGRRTTVAPTSVGRLLTSLGRRTLHLCRAGKSPGRWCWKRDRYSEWMPLNRANWYLLRPVLSARFQFHLDDRYRQYRRIGGRTVRRHRAQAQGRLSGKPNRFFLFLQRHRAGKILVARQIESILFWVLQGRMDHEQHQETNP